MTESQPDDRVKTIPMQSNSAKTRRIKMPKLTPKQERFCSEYLMSLNGTKAAIAAGYSPATAEEQASRLLSNVKVQAEIDRLLKERSERCQISADKALALASELARSNIFVVLAAAKAGTVDELPDSVKRSVKAFKYRRIEEKNGVSEEISITMHDKISPLTLLWKHLGLGQSDAEAIATLTLYGKVTKTKRGYNFEYHDFGDDDDQYSNGAGGILPDDR